MFEQRAADGEADAGGQPVECNPPGDADGVHRAAGVEARAQDVGSGGSLRRECRGEGPRDARVWIVGEAPGAAECSHGRPFVGASGGVLTQLCNHAGINRGLCRIENVVERRPVANKIETVGREEMAAWRADLQQRIAAAPSGTLFVPLGATALNALSSSNGLSILKWRGSVLPIGGHTMIPSLHPSAILRSPHLMRRALVDWTRAGMLARGERVRAPDRELLLVGRDISYEAARYELFEAYSQNRPISIDIETLPTQKKITCVGFATSATRALTVSTHYPDFAGDVCEGVLEDSWALIRAVVASACPKIVQNGVGYDGPWLREVGGVVLGGRIFDCRWMHHAMYPSDGDSGEAHSLAYLASMYTGERYWKDEGRSADRITQLRYNGKDCAVTFEVWERLVEELQERGQWEYYCEAYESLYHPLTDPGHLGGGIQIDLEAREAKLAELAGDVVRIARELDAMAGVDAERIATLVGVTSNGERGKEAAAARKELKELRSKSIFGDGGGVSYPKIIKFLEVVCGAKLPKKKGPGEQGKDTGEVALRKLFLKSPKDSLLYKAVPLVLDYRNLTRQGTFLAEKNYDKDGRVRCTYTMLPETGRLSSQGNAFGTGQNLQNIMRDVRPVFVADEGTVLLEVDLSTAEDRVVKMLTGDRKMIELARTPPWELDQHRWNAALLYGRPESEITKADREVIKRTGHACNYDMGAATMSEQWLKDSEGTVVRTPEECKGLKRMYIDRCMPLLPQYHAEVRGEIMRYKCLSNAFGRILDLTWERLDEDTYKRGYAFKPQSTVGMLVNRFGLVPLWKWLRGEGRELRTRIAIQLHDALYLCVPPQHVWTVAGTVQRMLEQPVVYRGEPMTIPCAFTVSKRWKGKEAVEWKRLPGEAEMVEVAHGVVG